jgi:hypothetical protein
MASCITDRYKQKLSAAAEALANDVLPLEVGLLRGLELEGSALELAAEGTLGGSVDHLVTDVRVIRGPEDEEELGLVAAVVLIVHVVNGVPGLVGGKELEEGRVLSIAGAGVVDDDLSHLVVELENNEAVLVAKLDILEGGQTLRGSRNTGHGNRFLAQGKSEHPTWD